MSSKMVQAKRLASIFLVLFADLWVTGLCDLLTVNNGLFRFISRATTVDLYAVNMAIKPLLPTYFFNQW